MRVVGSAMQDVSVTALDTQISVKDQSLTQMFMSNIPMIQIKEQRNNLEIVCLNRRCSSSSEYFEKHIDFDPKVFSDRIHVLFALIALLGYLPNWEIAQICRECTHTHIDRNKMVSQV